VKKKILVIGGHGFLGRNLQEEFKNSAHDVYYESRRTGWNLSKYEEFKSKLETLNPDMIINAAAHVGSVHYVTTFAGDVCHDNTMMYLNLYRAISETNKKIVVVNAISNCSYPGDIDIQDEDSWWDGEMHHSVESYGMPKKMGFVLWQCYKRQHGIETINLIIPNSYGPHDYLEADRTHAMNGIIMRMMRQVKTDDKRFVVWGTGTPIREWIYMPDVAKIIRKVAEGKESLPNPINLGQEHGVAIIDTVGMVREILGCDLDIEFDLTKQDGNSKRVLGNRLFRQHFPDFKFTHYSVGIKNTIEYYKELI